MTECTRCGAKANNAFLCRPCLLTAQTTLADLPWWLNRLTEAAVGDTKMTDNAGRKSARRKDLDGDTDLAACIELLPKADDLDKARQARQNAALAHALATGGVNARASQLLATIADSLGYWCRVLCEIRGLNYTPSPLPRTPGANHARWLRVNIGAVATYDDAADIIGDIEGHLEDIVKVVNRPIRWWHLGECPGWRDDQPCQTELRVPEGSEEVHCRRCSTRHTVQLLLLARKAEAETKHMTKRELTRYNRELPAEFQVPPRTLRHWLDTGRLTASIERAGDPLYSWVDVRLLMLTTKHARKSAEPEKSR
jgi:hypothetical protein